MEVGLKIPKHYNTIATEISPRGVDFNGAKGFCTLIDELQAEVTEHPGTGFFHDRAALLQAYGEHRLYGLYVEYDDVMDMHMVCEDPIFAKWNHDQQHMILPCFLVLKEKWDGCGSVCEFIWTAKRARNKGLANLLLRFFDVTSAENTLPATHDFWCKYFKSNPEAGK
jgi:hypothetical protein